MLVLEDEAPQAAHHLDAERTAGSAPGPLHGIPAAIKDIIDVKGLPTRANSHSRADIAPAICDATLVAHLRAASAVILSKVHTTEYAYFESIPPTRNPHHLARTPGGSSGGSAAAVASGTVPLAIGGQTAGSVNRPAAYCGRRLQTVHPLGCGGRHRSVCADLRYAGSIRHRACGRHCTRNRVRTGSSRTT
jgi:aspartyl-tRNA(Asn)/glutamyl-tRNA(Gln) amidotransferase subunit A